MDSYFYIVHISFLFSEITCDPPYIPNGIYTPQLTKYRGEDKVIYECKSGFSPVIQGNVAMCTSHGWSPAPRCSFKPCDFPVIKHGRLHYAYGEYFPARLGQQFSYRCDQYFVPPSRSSWDYLTCTPQGWSPEVPCLRQCTFNYLENGHYPDYEKKYLQGETVRVHCYNGYSLQNYQNTMTCTENDWFPPPRCIRVSEKMWASPTNRHGDITSFPAPVYPPGSTVEYQFQSYYELQGNRHIVCQMEKWSEPPKCLEEIMKKHNIQLKWRRDKKLILKQMTLLEFTCKRGYNRRHQIVHFEQPVGKENWHNPTCG
uniref:Sushi domain-containing protein n=1 Tax=Balaenoptera musculus TaxID=9771 RepID=A0A8C0C593_BALMU